MLLNWKISFFEIVDYYDLYGFGANERRNLVMSLHTSLIPSGCYLSLVLLTAYRLAMRKDVLAKEWGKVFREPLVTVQIAFLHQLQSNS